MIEHGILDRNVVFSSLTASALVHQRALTDAKSIIKDRPLLGALDYWNRLRGGHPVPSHAAVDPVGLGPDLSPHLLVLDPVHALDGTVIDMVYRSAGPAIVARVGTDLTGTTLRERHGMSDYGTERLTALALVLSSGMPLYSEGIYALREAPGDVVETERRVTTQRLSLPFLLSGSDPAGKGPRFRILVAQTFQDIQGQGTVLDTHRHRRGATLAYYLFHPPRDHGNPRQDSHQR